MFYVPKFSNFCHKFAFFSICISLYETLKFIFIQFIFNSYSSKFPELPDHSLSFNRLQNMTIICIPLLHRRPSIQCIHWNYRHWRGYPHICPPLCIFRIYPSHAVMNLAPSICGCRPTYAYLPSHSCIYSFSSSYNRSHMSTKIRGSFHLLNRFFSHCAAGAPFYVHFPSFSLRLPHGIFSDIAVQIFSTYKKRGANRLCVF